MARGLAVMFMIFIHAQLFFANESVVESPFGIFNGFVGSVPAAPMFMFLMGIGVNYSRKQDPKVNIRRGAILIAGGYLLNFLRGYLPGVITAVRSGAESDWKLALAELTSVDILHFAGLALIMFGLFKLARASLPAIALTGLVLAAINIPISLIKVENFWLSSVAGLIWGTNEYSYFPFLTWQFYPIAGYVFGSYLIRCTNKKLFYRNALVASVVVFGGGLLFFNLLLGLPNGLMTEVGYYHHPLSDNLTFTALVIAEISLLFLAVRKVSPILEKIFLRWSRNVTPIFFIHWIFITWSALVIPKGSLGIFAFIGFLCVIIPASDLSAQLYVSVKKKIRGQ